MAWDMPRKPTASDMLAPRCDNQVAHVCRSVCGTTSLARPAASHNERKPLLTSSTGLPFHSTEKSMALRQRYTFRIKIKSGGIVGNIVFQGTSQPDAEVGLRRQYPDCTILDVHIG